MNRAEDLMTGTASTFDPRDFRDALGSFATGVTVITTRGPRGELVGNTATSFNSVSLEPPLVLWSLGRHAYSFKAYLSTDHFAVNVLREGQEELSARFSKSLGDKWQGLDYETGETGCPILPNALAVFECKTAYTYQGGDHIIFVGEVIKYDYDPEGRPLLFWHGGYHKL
jgi:3-hydroxy-9,10-secoandrosta-1,3,5(10)-triene-9,17-dione monooxygenase reductase component